MWIPQIHVIQPQRRAPSMGSQCLKGIWVASSMLRPQQQGGHSESDAAPVTSVTSARDPDKHLSVQIHPLPARSCSPPPESYLSAKSPSGLPVPAHSATDLSAQHRRGLPASCSYVSCSLRVCLPLAVLGHRFRPWPCALSCHVLWHCALYIPGVSYL